MSEQETFREDTMHTGSNPQMTNTRLIEEDSSTSGSSTSLEHLVSGRRPPRRSKLGTTTGDQSPKRNSGVRETSELRVSRPFTRGLLDAQRGDDSLADLAVPLSPKGQVEHVTHEVFLIVRLAVILWSYLGLGWRWTWNCCRLVIYALILMPGFLQMVVYYFFSSQVRRSVIYGRKPRNRLDFYIPQTESIDKTGWPVVIFITGGAWTIGYKAWGALLGRRLSESGILVVSLDYRNFPQGSCQDMLEDINTGISWVFRKIHRFGGHPENIYLCGQSAGGHLAAMAMLTQVEQLTCGSSILGRGHRWDPRDLKGFVGVSGTYSLPDLADHLDKRGLYKSMFQTIMSIDGETKLDLLSPVFIAKQLMLCLKFYLPEVLLLHGKKDNSVPYASAEDFAAVLSDAGVDCKCKIYEGKSHTQPLIEDPLKGGQDCLMEDILSIVLKEEISINQKPLVPAILTKMASVVCPF
eukprot:g656.t1